MRVAALALLMAACSSGEDADGSSVSQPPRDGGSGGARSEIPAAEAGSPSAEDTKADSLPDANADTSLPDVAVDAQVRQFSTSVCDKVLACGCTNVSAQIACAAQLSTRLLAPYIGKPVTYDSSCADKMLTTLTGLGCSGQSEVDFKVFLNLGCAILSGTGTIGSPCVPDLYNAGCSYGRACVIDSGSVSFSDAGIDASGVTAHCQSIKRDFGESCDILKQSCSTGYCDGTCTAYLTEGATCSSGSTPLGTCTSGTYCASTHACASLPGPGATCEFACTQGYYCDLSTKKCLAMLTEGSVCLTTTPTVWSGICQLGLSCAQTSGDASYRCRGNKHYGDPCQIPDASTDPKCPDSACAEGKCVKVPYVCGYARAY